MIILFLLVYCCLIYQIIFCTVCVLNVYRRNFNYESKCNLYDSLKQCNIVNYLSNDLNADPIVTFNIFEELITRNLNKHIPLRKYKIHKHKDSQT